MESNLQLSSVACIKLLNKIANTKLHIFLDALQNISYGMTGLRVKTINYFKHQHNFNCDDHFAYSNDLSV